MIQLARLRPLLQVALSLVLPVLLVNVCLHGLDSTPVLRWLPKAVAGTGYLEDNRRRVVDAWQDYRDKRVGADDHLGAIVGISNVREAVDLKTVANAAGAGWHFIGLGGAGLGMPDVGRTADVLLASDLRPDLVVLGISLNQIVDTRPKPGSTNVSVLRYLRQGDLRNTALAARDGLWFYERRQDVSLALEAALLDRREPLLRWFNVHLPEPPDSVRSPWREMIKSDWPEHFSPSTLREEEEFLEALGVFAPSTYVEASRAPARLAGLIRQFRGRDAKVVVLLMPEQSTLQRRTPPEAFDVFRRTLEREFPTDLPPVIDLRKAVPDTGFVDLSHLNRRGSLEFSRLMADRVRSLLPTGASPMKAALRLEGF